MTEQAQNNTNGTELVGLLAQFDDSDQLVEAGRQARDAGYAQLDAYSPFPVHGIDEAIGIRRSILPWIVFAVGVSACAFAIFLQWYANAASSAPFWPGYDFKISGKPTWSLPANIPPTFEIIVLLSAFASFLGMLILNQLPKFANPLHRIARFKRVTNDRFFLAISARDDQFDAQNTRGQLEDWGATDVEEVRLDKTDHQLPAFMRTVVILGAVLLLVPPVLIYRARGMTNSAPRLHVVPDMDFQVRFYRQKLGPNLQDDTERPAEWLFPHIRAAQLPRPGTIARGQLEEDSEFYQGIKNGSPLASTTAPATFVSTANGPQPTEQDPATEPAPAAESDQKTATGDQQPEAPPEPDWVTEFPPQLKIDRHTVEHGQKLFNIFCVACHGYAGEGDGLVNRRALELAVQGKATWTEAKSFHDPEVKIQPVGRYFDTITNGRSTMGPYGNRISPEDRWAIVLYLRALQETNLPPPPKIETGADATGAATDAGEAAGDEQGASEGDAKKDSGAPTGGSDTDKDNKSTN